MATVRVEFEVEVPDDCTVDEVNEWLRFSLGDRGSMSSDNPLADQEPEPVFGTFDWDYT